MQLNGELQPDIESINLAWNKFETTMDRVEKDFQQFLDQYERSKDHVDHDLDLFERDIAQIERHIQIEVRHWLSVDFFRSHRIELVFFSFLVESDRSRLNKELFNRKTSSIRSIVERLSNDPIAL